MAAISDEKGNKIAVLMSKWLKDPGLDFRT